MTIIQTAKNWFTDNLNGSDLGLTVKGAYRVFTDKQAEATFKQPGESFWSIGYAQFVEDNFVNGTGFDITSYNRFLNNGSQSKKALPLEEIEEIKESKQPLSAVQPNKLETINNTIHESLHITNTPVNEDEAIQIDELIQKAYEAHNRSKEVLVVRTPTDYCRENPTQIQADFCEMVECLDEAFELMKNSERPEIYDKSFTGEMMTPYVLALAQEEFPESFKVQNLPNKMSLESAIWRATGILNKATRVVDRKATKQVALNKVYSHMLGTVTNHMLNSNNISCQKIDSIVEDYENLLKRAKRNNSEFEIPKVQIQKRDEIETHKVTSNFVFYQSAINRYLNQISMIIEEQEAMEVASDNFMNWSTKGVERIVYFANQAELDENNASNLVKVVESLVEKRNGKAKSVENVLQEKSKELWGNYVDAVEEAEEFQYISTTIDQKEKQGKQIVLYLKRDKSLKELLNFTKNYSTVLGRTPKQMHQVCQNYAKLVAEEIKNEFESNKNSDSPKEDTPKYKIAPPN